MATDNPDPKLQRDNVMAHIPADLSGRHKRYVIREADVEPYAPANHAETSNRRIICRETVGAQFLEVLVGTLGPGAIAAPHAHPGIEQVVHVLEGTGEAEVDGEKVTFRPGDWVFLPQGSFHDLRVTGGQPLRLIVIYAPPYGERPEGVVTRWQGGATGTS